MKPLSMQAIRTQYPTPISYQGNLFQKAPYERGYCVGGAVLLAHGFGTTAARLPRFPNATELARVLQALNPALEAEEGQYWATVILDRNDHAEFGLAWKAVAEALTWRRQP